MKVFEVIDNGFVNRETTADHLFRIQVARFHELVLYWNSMRAKYPNFTAEVPFYQREDGPKDFNPPARFRSAITPMITSDRDVDIFIKKYILLISAKRAFKDAGGKYSHYALKNPIP